MKSLSPNPEQVPLRSSVGFSYRETERWDPMPGSSICAYQYWLSAFPSQGQGPNTEGCNFMHPPLAFLYLWAPLSPYGNIHSVCMACYLSCTMDTVTSCCLLFVLGGPYHTTRSSLVRLSTDAPWYHLGVLDNFSGTREFDSRVLIASFKQGTQKARLQKDTWHLREGTFQSVCSLDGRKRKPVFRFGPRI